jgi:hypothetical protein
MSVRAFTCFATPAIPTMPLRVHAVLICGVVAALACGKDDRTPLEYTQETRIIAHVSLDTDYLFPDTRRLLSASVTDGNGTPRNPGQVTITTSDSTVVVVDSLTRVTLEDLNGKLSYDGVAAVARFLKPGTAEVRVTISGIPNSIPVFVRPAPLESTAITVDSFTVFSMPACAEGCGTIFEPILRVSVPSDGPTVEVLAIELGLTTTGTGLCVGSRSIAPGRSDDLIYYTGGDYGYMDSPFPMWKAPDDSVIEEAATARLLVRESSSDIRELRVTGHIRRVTNWPEIPVTSDYSLMDWSCG